MIRLLLSFAKLRREESGALEALRRLFSDAISLGARALLTGELCGSPQEQWTVGVQGMAREIAALLQDKYWVRVP